ncbi:MAG: glycosyltransferase [Prevotella sp.]
MKIYFYHTQDVSTMRRRMEQGEFPTHFFYGATHLPDNGIDILWHDSRMGLPRWRMMLRNAWRILTRVDRIDAVYATHYRGLELIVLLRALGLFPRPVVIWHHQPVVRSRSRLREFFGRFFYRGFDRMIFFSRKLIDDSLHSPKMRPERAVLGHWGADLDFYDRIRRSSSAPREGFVSTGKELRDMPTLVSAFNSTGLPLDIYIGRNTGGVNYENVFGEYPPADNIRVHYINGLCPDALARKVDAAACVVICCKETRYTVGLTTVVEALALGLPVICSRNPQIPVDFDREGCGITVPYYDREGWKQAISYIASHPDEAREMGERGRRLAERMFNDVQCAREMAEVLRSVVRG